MLIEADRDNDYDNLKSQGLTSWGKSHLEVPRMFVLRNLLKYTCT